MEYNLYIVPEKYSSNKNIKNVFHRMLSGLSDT